MTSTAEPLVILFDGVCNLCAGCVQFVIARDHEQRFRFASLQSEVGAQLLAAHGGVDERLSSMVLIEDGRLHQKSTAALRTARHLSGGWPALALLLVIPRPLRDMVYDWVGRHRYQWFGQRETCWLPTPELLDRFLDQPEGPDARVAPQG